MLIDLMSGVANYNLLLVPGDNSSVELGNESYALDGIYFYKLCKLQASTNNILANS